MDPTILVVEDDPLLREVIAEVLSDEGFTVHEAADGQRALEEIESDTPDLVLSDMSMPRLGGRELAEQLSLRADPVPIVLMSAASNAPPDSRAMFLAKPFTIDELLAVVARVLIERPQPSFGAPIPARS
ncbi:MAG: response regulator [Thermomicrobiales bacterium]